MNVTDPEGLVDAARGYEALFVPSLFEQWVPHVAHAAGVRPGDRVLDVACGTGVLARGMQRIVGASGSVSAIDINPGMLSVAREIAPGIDWREGAAEALPFPNESFDALVSQFGLMFFRDRRRAIGEMLRVLKPGGRLAVAVWDRLEHNPGYDVLCHILNRAVGDTAARALRTPFALGDREALAALFVEAGANGVAVETHGGTARFPSVRVMAEADLRGWLPVVGVVLSEEQIERVLAQAETELSPYEGPNGQVAFQVSAHIVGVRARV